MTHWKINLNRKLFIFFMIFSFLDLNANISGIVFRDFNANGILDKGEVGVENVTINVYDVNGNLSATAKSESNGTYNISLSKDAPYRIEFTDYPDYLQIGVTNSEDSAKVQFVKTNNADNINFALNNPSQYNLGKEKTAFAVPTQHVGTSVGKDDIDTKYGFVSLPFTAKGDWTGEGDIGTPRPSKDVAFDKIGTVWGSAYQRNSGYLYSAAFLKRHYGLGELVRPDVDTGEKQVPVDGIYVMDYSGSVGGTYKGGVTLNGITPAEGNGGVIDLGTVTREIISNEVDSSHPNALTTNTNNDKTFDVDAFSKVGKVGFGDLDIEENDKNLWVVNLNQQSLIKIDATDPTKLTTNRTIDSSLVSHYKIDFSSLPSCDGVYRPWALSFNDGKGYVGAICDATTSKKANDLKAYILEFDPNNPTNFKNIKEVSLNYPRETTQYAPTAGVCSLGSQSDWNYWATNWDELGSALGKDATNVDDEKYGAERACPQPILSDITFDTNGDMVLAFIDRFAMQLAFSYYAADSSYGTDRYYTVDSAGDIIHLCKSDNGYLVEGESGCVIDSDTKDDNDKPDDRYKLDDGPNGVGEFYFQDYSSEYDNDNDDLGTHDDGGREAHHVETALGSATILSGTSEVLLTSYDPILGEFSQGFLWFNTNNKDVDGIKGGRVSQYQLQKRDDEILNTKSSALGDVELIVPEAPIEVGDRVWFDLNNNGIQDATEDGISGVKVQLLDDSGDFIAEVTTDSNGYYKFSNDPNGVDDIDNGKKYAIAELMANHKYTIRISDVNGDNKQDSLLDYNLTKANVDDGNNSDLRDSDGVLNGNNADATVLSQDIPQSGANNHSFDFGFTKTYCIGDRVWLDEDKDGIQDSSESNFQKSITITLLDENDNNISSITTTNGEYKFCKLSLGKYKIRITDLSDEYEISLKDIGSDDTKDNDIDQSIKESDIIDLKDNNLTIDIGVYKEEVTYCLGDYIWFDKDEDGVQDDDENGAENIKVTLRETNATANTDKDGKYKFCGLKNGEYSIKVDIPNGYVATLKDKDNDNVDSDIDSNGVSQTVTIKDSNNTTLDAGLTKEKKTYCLGDYIWYDNNKNGIQDSGENGVANVKITLDQNTSKTATTDSNGKYNICGLENGSYSITVDKSSLPNGYEITSKDSGSDNSVDSDIDSNGKSDTIEIKDANNTTLDGGIYKKEVPTYCLGDYIWYDNNKNGIQDSDESGVSGVKITLDQNTSKTATTDSNGKYNICGLENGSYSITIDKSSLPNGYEITSKNSGDDKLDSDIDSNGKSDTIEIKIEIKDANNTTLDGGIYKPKTPTYCLGDYIWYDNNKNGIQDNEESGVANIKITLDQNTSKTATTDSNGKQIVMENIIFVDWKMEVIL